MGVATATLVETFRARDWRHFDVQLLLYVVLLITVGVVMGYSAAFNDGAEAAGMSQTVKTLIWAAIGLTLFFVASSIDYHWLRTLGPADLPASCSGCWRSPCSSARTCSAPRCR